MQTQKNKKQYKAPQVTSISKAKGNDLSTVTAAAKSVFVALATVVSEALAKPETYGPLFSLLKKTKETVEGLHNSMRDAIKEYTLANGEQTTEGGQLVATVGNWKLTLRPRAKPGTLDAKKVEGLLRSKGLNPDEWMDPTISYAVNEEKWQTLIQRKRVSADESTGCEKDLEYNVMAPTLDGQGE